MISTQQSKLKKTTTSVSLPRILHRKARKMGLSLSQVLRTALEAHLSQEEKPVRKVKTKRKAA